MLEDLISKARTLARTRAVDPLREGLSEDRSRDRDPQDSEPPHEANRRPYFDRKQDIMEDGLKVAENNERMDGVFEWCPQMKEWLRDENYIFYLGISPLNWNGGGTP